MLESALDLDKQQTDTDTATFRLASNKPLQLLGGVCLCVCVCLSGIGSRQTHKHTNTHTQLADGRQRHMRRMRNVQFVLQLLANCSSHSHWHSQSHTPTRYSTAKNQFYDSQHIAGCWILLLLGNSIVNKTNNCSEKRKSGKSNKLFRVSRLIAFINRLPK